MCESIGMYMCMSVQYICICMYVHSYVNMYAHTYMHTSYMKIFRIRYRYKDINIHATIYSCACLSTHIYKYGIIYTNRYINVCIYDLYIQMHSIHTYIFIYIPINICTHIHNLYLYVYTCVYTNYLRIEIRIFKIFFIALEIFLSISHSFQLICI